MNNVQKFWCSKIVEYFGVAQMTVCIEELSELIQALSKYQRLFGGQPPRKDKDTIRADIIEEIADVEIMLEQVREFLKIEPEEVSEIIDKKLDRTIRIIEEMKEERVRRCAQ